MSRFNQKPENALKKANEFIDVGKPSRALETLYDVLKSKRNRTAPTNRILEPIMLKYLELCVELRKSHSAKEGLFQYRNMCQTTNVASLEFVVKRYLELAEQKTAQSRKESNQAVLDVDDLDNIPTPEGILMRAVSGEDAQDRSDRTILMPWVKFLWESYRQCLELLRTNVRVESLYHYVAIKGFSFCEEYKRKTEFRKLCDNLRTHLQHVTRQIPGDPNVINFQQPETQQMNLETRLDQLDKAIKMELWTEAYKAIEDIHEFTVLSKKTPLPKMLAHYYEKLALILWKAGNQLFHATALSKLFQLSKSLMKNITAEELQDLATRVLVATLAIPLPSAHPEFDRFFETEKSAMEKQQRLAQLLYLQQPPTRAGLIKDLGRYNVVNYVHPKLKELYDALEVDFEPLKICVRVDGSLQFMRTSEERLMKDLREYIPALQDITLTRLVKQLAQIYDNISYSNLLNLAVFSDFFSLERVIVNAVRHNDMQIRVDHRNECIHFGTDLAECQREEIEEGPTLQPMPSEVFRTQLINVSTTLTDFLSTVQNEQRERKNYEIRARIVQQYFDHAQRDRAGILARQKTIEARKEEMEKQAREREVEEQKKQEEAARNQHLAEQKRLDLERQEREKKRQEDELKAINTKQIKDKIAQLTQSAHGQKVAQRLGSEMESIDPETLLARQLEELEKERRETANRLKSQEKKIDHLERAKRQEEIPLLQKELEARQVKEKEEYQKEEKERVAHIIEERKIAVANKDRLLRMKDDNNVFMDMMIKRRREEYQGKLEAWKIKVAEIKLAEKRNEIRQQRRESVRREREEAIIRQKEEEERMIREKQKKEQEETLRREKEERERHNRELDKQAEIQRKCQQEIEEKERERQAREEISREERRGLGREVPSDDSWRRPRSGQADTLIRPESYRPPQGERAYKPPQSRSDKFSAREDGKPLGETSSLRGGIGAADEVSSWRSDRRGEDRERPTEHYGARERRLDAFPERNRYGDRGGRFGDRPQEGRPDTFPERDRYEARGGRFGDRPQESRGFESRDFGRKDREFDRREPERRNLDSRQRGMREPDRRDSGISDLERRDRDMGRGDEGSWRKSDYGSSRSKENQRDAREVGDREKRAWEPRPREEPRGFERGGDRPPMRQLFPQRMGRDRDILPQPMDDGSADTEGSGWQTQQSRRKR